MKSGDIVAYPYLWAWQAKRGETEGRKSRPCCMIIPRVDRRTGATILYLFAISRQRPQQGRAAIDIPVLERRRAGLDDREAAWLSIDEYNVDILEESFYLELRSPPLGHFSDAFLDVVLTEIDATIRQRRRIARIDRNR